MDAKSRNAVETIPRHKELTASLDIGYELYAIHIRHWRNVYCLLSALQSTLGLHLRTRVEQKNVIPTQRFYFTRYQT